MTRPWFPDRAWFEARLTGFGASEAGALLGVSPWQTARGVMEGKIRRTIPDPDAPEGLRLRLGRDMEPILLEHLYETLIERRGGAIRPRRPDPNRMFRRPDRPWVYAHVDGFVGPELVELKTDEYGSQPWGPEDGDPARAVPPTYYAQVQHALAATGRGSQALLFVQVGLHEQLLYEVPRSDDYIEALWEVEDELWERVLEGRRLLDRDPGASIDHLLPPLEGEQLSEHLRKAYPRNDEVIRQATPEQELVIARMRAARQALKAAELEDKRAAAAVQDIILEAAGVSSPLGTCTWRRSEDGEKVAWELVAAAYRTLLRDCRSVLEACPPGSIQGHIEELITEARLEAVQTLYTSKTEGSRRFLVPQAWNKTGGA